MKPLYFVGSARDDLREFPDEVRNAMGFALYQAQKGQKHPHAKPLKGFSGAGVLEVIRPFQGDAYRTVYTVTLRHAIYVLHAFKKKSRHGIETPRQEIELIRARLREAQEHHATTFTG